MSHDEDANRIVGSAYATYAGSVRRYLTSVTRDVTAAEDLTQDAFLRLTVEVAAGRVPDNIGPWLHRVGHNLVMSRARRQSVADRHLAALARSDFGGSPEAAVVRHEEEKAAVDALGDLTVAQQRAVILASYGVDGPTIARSIGRSQGATRTLLCRGRARLRTSLLAAQLG
jgi:RNA polymerase sigma factor (sigma-70 family)